MLALEIYLGLVLGCFLVIAWKLIAWVVTRSDPYPPEAAEAPKTDGVEKQYAQVGDTFGFLSGRVPVVVPDVDGDQLLAFAEQLIRRHQRGEDITKDAPKERV